MTWAIILCRFRDVATTQPVAYLQQYFTRAGKGTGGSYDYWQQVSGGRLDDQSAVFGWFDIPHDSSEINHGLSRSVYQQWGFDAANAHNVPLAQFPRRIFFFNANGDHGATGDGTTVFSYAPTRALEPTFISHETGHTLGLGHSFAKVQAGCCGSSTPGEYCDPWDIMSAMCVFNFANGTGLAGPGLSAPYLDKLGWLDAARVFTNWETGSASMDIDLAPLSQPDRPGYLAARMDNNVLIEFRTNTKFDQGLPNAAVLVHQVGQPFNGNTDPTQSLLVGHDIPNNRPNMDWQVGDEYVQHAVAPFSMKVLSIDPAGTAKIRLTKQGLGPLWMSQGRMDGAGMHWSRGNDFFVVADVDGDKRDEVLVANNDNTYIGLLRWTGNAMAPIWIAGGRIEGTNMHWSRGADTILAADVDGDGRKEFLIANNSNTSIGILKWTGAGLAPVWIGANRINGVNMHWSRGNDQFVVGDVDGDGHDEVVIFNNDNGAIGILKWTGGALAPVWISNGRIDGLNMHWNRGQDLIVAADLDGDGRKELVIANDSNGAIGILKWTAAGMQPLWIVASGRLDGANVHWNRGADFFVAADVDGDGHSEILIANPSSNYFGLLKWDGANLKPVFVAPMGSAAGFNHFKSAFAADLDANRSQRLVVPSDAATLILRWDGASLVADWFAMNSLIGTAGTWLRAGTDMLLAADVDGDGHTDVFIAQNRTAWTGLLKWTRQVSPQ